jgi:site-specific recombinase XerD
MPDAAIVPFDPSRRRSTSRRRPQPAASAGLSLAKAMDSWEVALNARNRSAGTIGSYRETVAVFAAWLAADGAPDDVEELSADHVRRFLAHEIGRAYNKPDGKAVKKTKPGNAAKHFRNLRALFNWLIEEEERTPPSPVSRKDEPTVPKEERPPFSDEEIRALLATCKAKTFENLRDEAIMRLLIDSGPRRSGVAGIRWNPGDPDEHDVDLRKYRVRITLKGGDTLWIPIGKNTAKAIDRFIRARGRHQHGDLRWLWISDRGRFSGSGMYQMVRRRGRAAGVEHVYLHRFRRTSATAFLDGGGTETDAMNVYGWSDPTMVRHYTEETARERARQVHARLSPGDRF